MNLDTFKPRTVLLIIHLPNIGHYDNVNFIVFKEPLFSFNIKRGNCYNFSFAYFRFNVSELPF